MNQPDEIFKDLKKIHEAFNIKPNNYRDHEGKPVNFNYKVTGLELLKKPDFVGGLFPNKYTGSKSFIFMKQSIDVNKFMEYILHPHVWAFQCKNNNRINMDILVSAKKADRLYSKHSEFIPQKQNVTTVADHSPDRDLGDEYGDDNPFN